MQPSATAAAKSAVPAIDQWHKAVADLSAEIKVRHYSPKTLKSHSDVRTTMIYTHCVPSRTVKEARSPLDFSLPD